MWHISLSRDGRSSVYSRRYRPAARASLSRLPSSPPRSWSLSWFSQTFANVSCLFVKCHTGIYDRTKIRFLVQCIWRGSSVSRYRFSPPRVIFTLACFVKSERTPNAKNSADVECSSRNSSSQFWSRRRDIITRAMSAKFAGIIWSIASGSGGGRDAWNARCARPLKQMEFLRVRRPSGVTIAPTATRSSHDGCIWKFLCDAVNGRRRRALRYRASRYARTLDFSLIVRIGVSPFLHALEPFFSAFLIDLSTCTTINLLFSIIVMYERLEKYVWGSVLIA